VQELLQEKVLHLKETRRIREEDQSQLLNNTPVQPAKDARFVITELIGKGGFSEVYKVASSCFGDSSPHLLTFES
jgi:hypothetical protein